MLKYFPVGNLLIVLFFLTLACQPPTNTTAMTKGSSKLSPEIQQRIKEIMSTMNLIDKCGEMTQVAIDMITVGEPYAPKEPQTLDTAKLRKVLLDHRVGSILNVAGHAYSLDYWHEVIGTIQRYATEMKPTGIPVLYGIDAIHGQNYTLESTLFPQQIGLAATWNLQHAKEMGRITAYEAKASWIPWNFSPVLDIGRNPLWSRTWETFGEDVHLAKAMGVALIKGNQGDDLSDPYRVAACMKHFLGYSMSLNGKDRTQAYVPDRVLREYVLPTFEAAIEAGTPTIMINSGEVNGIPVHSDKAILTTLLRDELGFEGLAVTDWEDIHFLYSRHRVAKDYKDAIRMAINAGIDMSMVPVDLEFPVLLKELVEEGEVPMWRIDEAVSRVLAVKLQLGLFENPTPKGDYSKFGSAEHAQVAYNTAVESITLLKNDNNILPLNKSRRIAVLGPTANSLIALNGGWSRTWQGTDPQWNTKGKKTILQAIQNEVGAANVKYVEGTTVDEVKNINAAVAAARGAQAAVICIGEFPYTEKPGDIDNLELPKAQVDLVKAVAKSGTPVVLVMVAGRPRVIRDVVDDADGIFMAYLPGDEGGLAVADLLFGDANPSGRLPFTWPKHSNDINTYDHKGTNLAARDFSMNGFQPQYEFGHGLSYTGFEYSDLQLSSKNIPMNGTVDISVTVKNTGQRGGKETVRLFIHDRVASITPPMKRLRGFDKIELGSGESKVVTFKINTDDLAFVGRDNEWITEPGAFDVMIEDLKAALIVEELAQ